MKTLLEMEVDIQLIKERLIKSEKVINMQTEALQRLGSAVERLAKLMDELVK